MVTDDLGGIWIKTIFCSHYKPTERPDQQAESKHSSNLTTLFFIIAITYLKNLVVPVTQLEH